MKHTVLSTVQYLMVTLSIFSTTVSAELEAYRTDLPPALDDSGWDLMLEKNGIKVFTRDWPGSDFIAFKAEQVVQSKLSNIVANFSDIKTFPEWVKDMVDAYEIEPFDDKRSRKIYMRMGLPWPLADRDIVAGQQLTQETDSKVVRIKEWFEGDALPKNEGVIRTPKVNNELVLIPEGNEKTRIVWQGHTEPGGFIPAFIVNFLLEDVFYESVLNMRHRFESPEFHKTSDWVINYNDSGTES